MRTRTALLLWTLFSVSSCAPEVKRTAVALRPDQTNPERFVCELAGSRPKLPPEYKIDWQRVAAAASVEQAVSLAQDEQAKFVATLRTRENVVAGYLLKIEGNLFVCFNNMKWQREFYQGLDQPAPGGPSR